MWVFSLGTGASVEAEETSRETQWDVNEWSQYLHDRSKYRVDFDGEVSLRLVRGLSIDLEAFAARQRDQLSLPRRGATPEEVLLRLRELQSGYELRFSFGVTYTFGRFSTTSSTRVSAIGAAGTERHARERGGSSAIRSRRHNPWYICALFRALMQIKTMLEFLSDPQSHGINGR